MAANDAGTATEPQEIRIALVMNGGVSLAVWMGGITAELDRLRRAGYPEDAFQPAPGGGEGSADDAVTDSWRCLLDALGATVAIDVIAGASAGGLNGSLLAASIARGWVVPDLRETWLSLASITRLASDRANPDRLSVLDGDFFAEQIGQVFGRVLPDTDARVVAWPDELDAATELVGGYLAAQRRCPSAVTLTTAVTSVHGQPLTYRDSTGASFGQREYRVHCRFQHGIDRDDFSRPQAAAQLTRSARASASFPGAFEAAFFNDDSGSPRRGPLGAGPDMREVAGIDGRRWVIDGGVLNNEPFEAVLDEIASRPIDHDIDRVIAYVVPSGGDGEVTADSFDQRLGLIDAELAAVSLPREMNLLNELDRMAKMASQADADRAAGARLLVRALAGELDGPADALLAEYRERRAAASVWEARRLGLANRAEIGLQPQQEPDAEPLADRDPPLRWIPAAGGSLGDAELGERWEWGLAAAERVIRTALRLNRGAARHQGGQVSSAALLTLSACLLQLDHLRAGFEQKLQRTMSAATAEQDRPREILGHIDACYDDLPERLAPLVATALDTMVAGWPAMAAELRLQAPADGLEAALTATADGTHPDTGSQPIELVAASLHAMVDAWDGVITDLLAHDPVRALERLRSRAGGTAVAEPPPAAAATGNDPRTRLLRAILRVEVVERATAPIAPYQPVPRFRFQRFGVHTGTPLIDAGTPITNKLFGSSAGHFGGFLRASWRAHDWMWGRLDGATHLVNMLFVPGCLRRSLVDGVDDDAFAQRRRALAACAGDAALAGHLDDFRAGCAAGAADERLREIVDPVRRALIERLHQQILHDELPRMAGDPALSADTRTAIAGLGGQAPRYGDALDGVRHDLARSTGQLADTEQGHEVIGMMAASGLRALGRDPHLPGRRRLARPLSITAAIIRLATAGGPRGGLARAVIAALLLVLTLSPLWAGLLPASAAGWFLRAALATAATAFAFVALPVMPHWFRRGFGWLKRAPVSVLKR